MCIKHELRKIFHVTWINKFLVILVSLSFFLFLSKKYSFSLFFVILFVIVGAHQIYNYFIIKKLSKKISLEELNKIKEEIKIPIVEQKMRYIFTNSYIILQGLHIALIKYEDIVLFYKDSRYDGRCFSTYLGLITSDNKKYKILVQTDSLPMKADTSDFEKIIKFKNPNALFGYSKNNIKRIKSQHNLK